MKLEVDAKMFIESINQSGSNNLKEIGDLSKGKESVLSNGAHKSEGISNMPKITPSKDSHSSGMTVIQSIDQALPDISAKQSASSVEVIDSVHTADDMQNHAMNSVKYATLTPIASTEQLSQSTFQTGAYTFKLEKPKLPVFAGNVRDYAIFRSDFKHAIEGKESTRREMR